MKSVIAFIGFILICGYTNAQKIEKSEFDPYDSVFIITTNDLIIGTIDYSDIVDSATNERLKNPKTSTSFLRDSGAKKSLAKIMMRMNEPNISFKIGRYIPIKNKKVKPENLTAYASFTAPAAVSLDKRTTIKIMFTDNTIKEYKNEADYNVKGEKEIATIYFTVPKNDFLRTKEIKGAKLQANDLVIEIKTDQFSKGYVKNMINLVQSEKIKLE